MTASLPTPGKDNGTWGTILNDFLLVSHNADGTLKSSAVTAAGAGTYSKPAGGIPSSDLSSSVQNDLALASNAVQLAGDLGGSVTDPTVSKLQGTSLNGSSPTDGQVLTYSSTANAWVPGTVSSTTVNDATTSSKGIIELTGDLGGTASSPTVLSTHLSSPLPLNQGGTGSTTQNFVDLSSNQTIAGTKTFSSTITGNISGNAGTVTTIPGLTGDVTSSGSSNVTTVGKVQGINISGTAPSSSGQVLTSTSSTGAAWQAPPAAPVTTVAGRTGAIVLAESDITNLSTDLSNKAPLASPALTGIPTAPTATVGTNTTQLATTAFVTTAQPANATSSTPGLIQLSGDLGGTATSPTVAKLNGITAPSSAPSGAGQVLTSTSTTASAWSTPTTNASSIDGVTVTGTASNNATLIASSSSAAAWQGAPLTIAQGGTGSTSQNFVDLSSTQTVGGSKTFSGSATLNGATQVSDKSSATNVALRNASSDKIIYVSKATSASDSNDGLSWGSALATIAAALTAIGSGAGVIQLGYGTWTISSADGNGNAITLQTYQKVKGLGRYFSVININCTVTWGIQCQGGAAEVSDLTVSCGGSGTCTYGVGVQTPNSTGSAEACYFENVICGSGSGSMTNGFSVSPLYDDDIAETYFFHCVASGLSSAGFTLNNGVAGNVLNTFMYGCGANESQYGVYCNNSNFHWDGGTTQKNGYDFYFAASAPSASCTIANFRSENSGSLLYSPPNTGGWANIMIKDVTWAGVGATGPYYPITSGQFINWGFEGLLTIENVSMITATTSPYNITPVIYLQQNGPLSVNALNLALPVPVTQAFATSGPSNQAVVQLNGYVQLDPTTNYILSGSSATGTYNLAPSATQVSINGSNLYVMLPATNKSTPSPADLGAKAWTGYPGYSQGSFKPSAGYAGFVISWIVWVAQPCTITNINYAVSTAGASLSNTSVGLYSSGSTINLLAQCTTDQSTNMQTIGAYVAALSSPYTITVPGLYRVALLIGSATTMPTFIAVNNSGAASGPYINLGISSSTNIAGYGGGGLTSLPSSTGAASNALGVPLIVLN